MSKTIKTKRCTQCKQFKAISEFHKNRRRNNGLQSHCKSCAVIMNKKYRQTKKGKIYQKHYQKLYFQSENGKAAHKRYRQSEKYKSVRKKFKSRNPNFIKAKNAVNDAIRAGKMQKASSYKCAHCPKQAQQYHHHKENIQMNKLIISIFQHPNHYTMNPFR